MNSGALSEEDFAVFTDKNGETYGLYEKGEIENDRQTVREYKRSFEIQDKKNELSFYDYERFVIVQETAQYLEALFYEKLGGPQGWIPNALVYKTSEFDDIENGVDFVVELEEDHFGVAIDVTLSRKEKVILDKLKRTKKLIDSNKLAEVKYYERPGDAEIGAVPLAVIALDYDHAVQALKFWADGDDDLLSKHPTRVKAWLETGAQFEAYAMYATHKGNEVIAEAYDRAAQMMNTIIEKHQDVVERYRSLIEKDEAYQTIISFCDDLKFSSQEKKAA